MSLANRAGMLLATLVACARPGMQPPAAGDVPRLSLTSDPVLVARGLVSTGYSEVRLAASPDGRLLLWGSTDRPGQGGYDIWMSRREQDTWSAPEPVPFNSSANDFDPAFTADGKLVYFFSNRPGGVGGADLYRVPVTGRTFGAVEHLGPEVNTPGDEWAPTPSPDGTQLVFAARPPKGKLDLYVARTQGDGFAKAQPLPGELNTPEGDELDPTFLADGRSLVFSRSPDIDSTPVRLYYSALGPSGYEAGTELPRSINVPGGSSFGPSIDGADPQTLYVSSRRPEGGVGQLDIYRVRYSLGR